MNNMFFFFDIEKRIGLKKLTSADLGISSTSNQTQIGLYNDVLTFLGDNVVTTAMLVYEGYCKILDCYFDRIANPDGTKRSPKFRVGNGYEDSVVSKIREFSLLDTNAEWYLLWSGLESKDLVFWLISSKSYDFEIIKNLISSRTHIITDEDTCYANLKSIMVNKINNSSLDIQKDIEIISQTGVQSKKYKPFDLKKAQRYIAMVGKRGEELVNDYLERMKSLKELRSFEWMNRSKESGLPYDFILNCADNKEQYIDVKSTRFDFSQNIVFSNQEVSFVNQQKSDIGYSVYRVFDITETNANLRICTQCMPYMEEMNKNVQIFNEAITLSKTKLLNMNIAVCPNDCFGKIQDTIKL